MAAGEALLDLGSLSSLAGTRRSNEDHADVLGSGRAALATFEALDAGLEVRDDILHLAKLIVDETHGCGLLICALRSVARLPALMEWWESLEEEEQLDDCDCSEEVASTVCRDAMEGL